MRTSSVELNQEKWGSISQGDNWDSAVCTLGTAAGRLGREWDFHCFDCSRCSLCQSMNGSVTYVEVNAEKTLIVSVEIIVSTDETLAS